MKKVLVIGNKPYHNLPMNNLLDRFSNNVRCGMAIPNDDYNNGTIFDEVGFCNHLYERLVLKNISLDDFINYYSVKGGNSKEYVEKFYNFFQKNKDQYNRVFYAEHKPTIWNNMLAKWGCPYRFSQIPRVGQDMIFENLALNNRVYVTNFSLYDKIRVSHGGFKYPDNWDEQCHSKDDEINSLFWLHRNNYLDATLCMLEDISVPTLRCKGITPSSEIINVLRHEYGELKIIEE
jgi:hypothetical protein